MHQSRNSAAALSSWLKINISVTGKPWVESLVVFTHDDCSLTLELDETSNTSVSVLLLDELKEWITARKSSVSSKIENEVLVFFNGLNGEEVTIDRGAREVNREFDMVAFLNIAVIVGFVISILIALSNRSGIALVVAVIMGFIFIIVLLSGNKNRYHLK